MIRPGRARPPATCHSARRTASATQIKAKAYLTIRGSSRSLRARRPGHHPSLCPIQLTDRRRTDVRLPSRGRDHHRKRLKNALTTQCLPQKLRSDEEKRPGRRFQCCRTSSPGSLADSDKKCGNIPDLTRLGEGGPRHLPPAAEARSSVDGDGGLDLSKLEGVVPQKTVRERLLAQTQTSSGGVRTTR